MKPDQTGSDLIQTFAKTGKCFVFRPQKFKNLQASRILQPDIFSWDPSKSPIEDLNQKVFSKHNSRKVILKYDECTRTYKYGNGSICGHRNMRFDPLSKSLRKNFDKVRILFSIIENFQTYW